MKRKEMSAPNWVVDYSAARAHAIRWLGDRYLLARPINASHYSPSTPGIIRASSDDSAPRADS